MAIELEHRFGRESRVRDYWVAASEGFDVQLPDGRSVGTVRQVVHEQDGTAAALLVDARRRLGRTERVVLGAETVEEVAPWRSTLVVPPVDAPLSAPAAAGLRRLSAVAVEACRKRYPPAVDAVRARWASGRNAATAGVSRSSHVVASAARRTVTIVRDRWPVLRGTVAAGVSAFARSGASTLRSTAAVTRAHWPGAQAALR
ncbi:MAG: hypothetical protein M3141_09565, partial [Actinomycetota bacterium]|nr:hypothetical protein [Actinomycetota bacterium]